MAEDLVTYPVTTEDGRTYQFKAPRGASQGDLESAAEKAEKAYFPGLPKLRDLPGLEGGMKGDIEQIQKVTAPRINKPAQTEDDPGVLSGYLGQMAGFGKGIVTGLPNKLSETYHGIKQIAGEIPGLRNYWGERTPEPVNPGDWYDVANQIITGTPLIGPAIESLESGKYREATGRGLAGANLAAVMGSPKARALPEGIVKGFQKADYPKPTMRDLRYSVPAALGGLASLARGNSIWGGLIEGGLAGLGLKTIPPMLKSMAREIPQAVSKAPWLQNFRGPKPIDAEPLIIPESPTPEAPTWPTRGMDPELENYPLPTIRPETPEPAYSPWNPVKYRGVIGNLPGDVARPVSGATWPNLGAEAAPEEWGNVAKKLQEISPYQETGEPIQPTEKYNLDLLTQKAPRPPMAAGQGRFTARGPIQAPIIDPKVIRPASELKMPAPDATAPETAPPVKAPKSEKQPVAPVMRSINTPLPERVPVRPPIASGATGSPAAISIPAGDKNIMDFVKNLSKKQAPVSTSPIVNNPTASAVASDAAASATPTVTTPKTAASEVTVNPPKKPEARDSVFNELDNLIKKGKGDESRAVLPPETVHARSATPVNRKDIVDFSGPKDHVTAGMIANKLGFAVDDVSKSLKAMTEQGYFEDLGNGRYKPTKLGWGKHLPDATASETTAPETAAPKKEPVESLELTDKATKRDRLKEFRESEAARERVTEDAPEEFSQELGGKLKDYINEKTGGKMGLKTVMRKLKELGYKVEVANIGPENYGAGSYKEGKYIPHESRKTPVSTEELANYREEMQIVKEYLKEYQEKNPNMFKKQNFKVHGDIKTRKTI